MTSARRTVGSLETFEPDDKSFSKHITKEGIGDDKPNDGAMCTVSVVFVENVPDEEVLGGYKNGEKVDITVGEGDTVLTEVIDKAVVSMKEQETSYIKTKLDSSGKKLQDFVVGDKGIRFNLTLHSFSRQAAIEDLEQDERLERAQHHKCKGTELYKANNMPFCIKRFKKALRYLKAMQPVEDLPESLRQEHVALKCQCIQNLGLIEYNNENWPKVISYCTKTLNLEPANVKALFRRGCAYIKQTLLEQATADFNKALELEPENKAASNKLLEIKKIRLKEKDMYKRMIEGDGDSAEDSK